MNPASTTYTITPGLPESKNPLGDNLWTKAGTQLSVTIDSIAGEMILRKTFGKNPSHSTYVLITDKIEKKHIKLITPEVLSFFQDKEHKEIRVNHQEQPAIMLEVGDLDELGKYIVRGSSTLIEALAEAKTTTAIPTKTISKIPLSPQL